MSPEPGGAPHRADLLVVDDTPENLGFLSAMLKAAGFRVRAVPSGPLALIACQAEAPDLLLLDVTMPGMDGYEVCRRLKADEALREIPVIFLSALSETEDKVRGFAAGGVDYVTKPFKVEEVTARIETHLALRRLRLDLEARNRELRESAARLSHLESVRQSLVQMIVHDLKGPIGAIQLSAQFAKQDPGDRDGVDRSLDDILHGTQAMLRMVLDVLDVARSQEARMVPRLAPVDLRALLDDVARDLGPAARLQRRDISVAVSDGAPAEVRADRELLRRIVENLVDNALKYTPRGTKVSVATAADGPGRWRLAVSDEGPGVPAELRERIFEAYARIDRDVNTNARVSRGLGLAFCRIAAEAHGGRVWVEAGAPRGSVFVVRLPVEPPEAERAAALLGAPPVAAAGA